MKLWFLLALLVPTSFASAGTARISGTVTDSSGAPRGLIVVEAFPVGTASSGGALQARTDDRGRFVLTVVSGRNADGSLFGQRWLLYVHQEDEYYPNLSSAFYTTPTSRAQEVSLAPGGDTVVELRLGSKAGALTGHVTDSVTGAILRPEFDLAWASGEPSKRMGIRTRDPYRILLPPNTDIKLIVQCEGHKPWIYPGTINVGPGEDMPLDFEMEPQPVPR